MEERKTVMVITGDGLTADELGRIRREIRKANYTRRKNKTMELRYDYKIKKGEKEKWD